MSKTFEEELKQVFKENRNENIPNEIQLVINKTLENLKSNTYKRRFLLKIISGCAILILTCGMVFAKDIKNLVSNIFQYNFNGNQGIQVAVDKGYVQNVNMDYIENNNIKFKIDYVTMDDSNLALNFNFLLDENAEGFKGISFYNMKIFDDEDNVIYTEEEQYPNEGIALGIGITKPIYVNGNNLIESFLIESDRFPKTKYLRITFDKIILYNENNGKPITKEMNGNFDITVELDEKFYNRETQIYNIKTENGIDNIGLSKVYLTDTSLNFIIDNSTLNELSIELKDENGKVLYNGEKIYLREINDETNRKIAKIDITKYEKLDKIIQLTIKAKCVSKDSKDVYLYNYQSENNRTYNVENIEKNSNYENNNNCMITVNYILKNEN